MKHGLFYSLNHSIIQQIILYTNTLLFLLFAACGEKTDPVPVEEAIGDVPWVRVIPNLDPVEGAGLTAQDCQQCHSDHYEDWSTSTHAHAYLDLQFHSELAKDSSPVWLCLNCHIPVENQRQYRVTHVEEGDYMRPIREPNPLYDPEFRNEGVTCATCHIRAEDGRSYIIGPGTGGEAPHPVQINREALVNRCMDCHEVTHYLDDALVCYFQTASELEAGHYAGDKTCVDCHMMPADPDEPMQGVAISSGIRHRHNFPGGGVPKHFGLYNHQQLPGGYRPGLKIDSFRYRLQADSINTWTNIRNARAGHKLPTGDPERYLQLEWIILDENGQELTRKEQRIGQEWEWEPVARQVSDNRLQPQESRLLREHISRPEKSHTLRLQIKHVRLNQDNADYMMYTADAVTERFRQYVRNLTDYYPRYTVFFRRDIDLQSGTETDYSLEQLITEARAGGKSLPDDL